MAVPKMWHCLALSLLASVAAAAVQIDPTAGNAHCFSVDSTWKAKMNNTGVAGNFSETARGLFRYGSEDPSNGGYCMVADMGQRKTRYLFDCEHPRSQMMLTFNGVDTVELTGKLVRCNTLWNGQICESQVDNGNVCEVEFSYLVRRDNETGRLIGDVKERGGGGILRCGKDTEQTTNFIAAPEERYLTLSGTPLQKGENGIVWLSQPNTIDQNIVDRRGEWSFSLVCPPDVDECATGTHTCSANARCTNTIGSFTCDCLPLYSGDGVTCEPNPNAVGGHVFYDANRDGVQTGDNGLADVTVKVLAATGALVNTTKTTNLGTFSFQLVPGIYKIQVDMPEGKSVSYAPYEAKGSNTIILTVEEKQTYAGIDFGLRDNLQTINGRVLDDITCDFQPLDDPGVSSVAVVLFNNEGAAIGQATTNCAGRFSIEAPPGDYFLTVTLPSGKVFSYTPEGVKNQTMGISVKSNEDISQLQFGLCDATEEVYAAVLHDQDKDRKPTGDAGYPGVVMKLVDQFGATLDEKKSNEEGYVRFDATPGTYKIQLTLPTGFIVSYGPDGSEGAAATVSVSAGKRPKPLVFGIRRASQTVSGKVLEDANKDKSPEGDKGAAGVAVYLIDKNNRVECNTKTDIDGNFRISGPPEDYTVRVTVPSGKIVSYDISGSLDGTASVTLTEGNNVEDVIFGIRDNVQTATGIILDDANRDGKPEGDLGMPGVIIQLSDNEGVPVGLLSTDDKGAFTTDLTPGTYTIQIVVPSKLTVSYAPDGASGNIAPLVIIPGMDNNRTVFGLKLIQQVVSGSVLLDANRDRRADGDKPIPGVTVSLYAKDGTKLGEALTDEEGSFKTKVIPGTYNVIIDVPNDKVLSYDISGKLDGTALISVVLGTDYTGVVFGLRDRTQVITGFVLEDLNRDGLAEGDKGYRGVSVQLIGEAGVVLRSVTTDVRGSFNFEYVPGMYTVALVVPEKKVVSYNPPGAQGGSLNITLPTDSGIDGLIFGLRCYTQKISGVILSDNNRDGKPDDDPGLAGVTVRLILSNGTEAGQGTSNVDGSFSFTVPPGSYTLRTDTPALKVISYNSEGTKETSAAVVVKELHDVDGFVFGFMDDKLGVITGKVMLDDNRDGTPLGDTRPVPLCPVFVVDAEGNQVAQTKTDAQGNFRFQELLPDRYVVRVESPEGYGPSYDSDDVADGSSVVAVRNDVPQSIVFGLKVTTGCMQGFVLLDANKDMLLTGDPGFTPSQKILLLDSNGQVLRDTMTEYDGYFEFYVIPEGAYQIQLIIPEGHLVSYQSGGGHNGTVNINILPAKTIQVVFGLVESSCALTGIVFEEKLSDDGFDKVREPVGDVVVRLIEGTGTVLETKKTLDNGTYVFPTFSPGNYTVAMEVPGQYVVSFDPDDNLDGRTKLIAKPTQRLEVNFGIARARGNITGTIVLTDGSGLVNENTQPISGVRLELLDTTGLVNSVATTNDQGVYGLAEILTGDYRLHVVVPPLLEVVLSPDGTHSDSVGVTVQNGVELTYNFNLRNVGQDVSGKVLVDSNRDGLPDGDPGGAGTTVKLWDMDGNLVSQAVTVCDGTYTFAKVQPGDYIVEVVPPPGQEISYQPEGAVDNKAKVTVVDQGVLDVTFGYRPIGNIVSGAVNEDVNYDGRPENDPPAAGVTINLLDTTKTVLQTAVSDDLGQFIFDDTVAGQYFLQLVVPKDSAIAYQPIGSVDGVFSIIVVAGQPLMGNTFGIRPNGAAVEGKIKNDSNRDGKADGDPGAPNVTVQLYNSQNEIVSTMVTNDAGSYKIPFVTVGQYKLQVVVPNDAEFAYQPTGAVDGAVVIEIQPGYPSVTTFGIKIKGAPVSGIVYLDSNNDKSPAGDEPMSGVSLHLVDPSLGDNGVLQTVTSDSKGIFGFVDVPPGNYNVEVVRPSGMVMSYQPNGLEDGIFPVTVLVGQPLTDIVFGLRPLGAPITGMVYNDADRNGIKTGDQGAGGIMVLLQDTQGRTLGNITTGADGTFVFPLVPVGDYIVVVWPPTDFVVSYQPPKCFRGQCAVFIIPDVAVSIDVGLKSIGAAVSGKVLRDSNFDGLPAGDSGIAGVEVQILKRGQEIAGQTVSDFDGTFSLPDLPAGTYVLKMTPPGKVTYSYGPEGATAEGWQFVMQPGKDISDSVFGYKPGTHDIPGRVLVDNNLDGSATGDAGAQGVQVKLADESKAIVSEVTTDNNGDFTFYDIPAGKFYVVVEPAGTEFAYQPHGATDGVFPFQSIPGSPIDITFGLLPPALVVINGAVLMDEVPYGVREGDTVGVPDIVVMLWNSNAVVIGETRTSANGTFRFSSLRSGNYSVMAMIPSGYQLSYDTSRLAEGLPTVSATNEIPGQVVIGIKRSTATVTGEVRVDDNGDGQPEGDPGLPGTNISLVDDADKVVGQFVTDQSGSFAIPEVVIGLYVLKIEVGPGRHVVYGPDDGLTDGTFVIVVTPDQVVQHIIGLSPELWKVTGLVMSDDDFSGDSQGDVPLPGVTVQLLSPAGEVVQKKESTVGGIFEFTNVLNGDYAVQVVPPTGRVFAYEPEGSVEGQLRITVNSDSGDFAFGFRPPYEAVTGQLLSDDNRDGLPEGDNVMGGVLVRLVDEFGTVKDSVTTDEQGAYAFPKAPYGNYQVKPDIPIDMEISYVIGGDQAGSANITIAPNKPATVTIGLRVRADASITVLVVSDDQGIGKVTDASKPVPLIEVRLYDGGSTTARNSLYTDEGGKATFSELTGGAYNVEIVPAYGQSFAFDADEVNDGRSDVTCKSGVASTLTFGVLRIRNSTVFIAAERDIEPFGQSTPGSPGLAGVAVTLTDSTGELVVKQVTGENGQSAFEKLPGGSYQFAVELPLAYAFSYGPDGSKDGQGRLDVPVNGRIDAVFGFVQTGIPCGNIVCDFNATCVDNSTCVCNLGYTGDGSTCTDIDECKGLNACPKRNTVCVNTAGSFSCPCQPGFSLVNEVCRVSQCEAQGYGDPLKCATIVPKLYEFGAVLVNTDWQQVAFITPFASKPVVVAGPAGMANEEAASVIVSNVTTRGFRVRLLASICSKGTHDQEQVGWFAVLPEFPTDVGGSRLFAKLAEVDVNSNYTVQQRFTRIPAVLGQVQDSVDGEHVAGQPYESREDRFSVSVIGEKNGTPRPKVTMGFIAMEPNMGGTNLFGGPAVRFAVVTSMSVTSDASTVSYSMAGFSAKRPPIILASLWARRNPQYAYARVKARLADSIVVKAEAVECATNSPRQVAKGKLSLIALRPML